MIVGGLTTIVKVCAAEVCWNWSVAVTLIGNEPVCVGVPDRVPVLFEKAIPGGSVPDSLHVKGCCALLPLALNVKL